MAIIGIDQSLTGTGLALLDNEGKLIKTKLVKTGKVMGVQRLEMITNEILTFCTDVKERFVIAREGYAFGAKGRATFSLGELGGCIDLTLYRHQRFSSSGFMVAFYVLPPNVVKKFCLGSGGIKKDSGYLLQVYNKLGKEFPDDNQADAFMIATTLHGLLIGSHSERKDHESFFTSLTDVKKEALLSPVAKDKELGITQATIKKMDRMSFGKHLVTGLEKIVIFKSEG
jgi:Holliday junction resolvasome RuvABC endonuclease subunit